MEHWKTAQKLEREKRSLLIQKYPAENPDLDFTLGLPACKIQDQLSAILFQLKRKDVQGLTIVDLGCGTRGSPDCFTGSWQQKQRYFEPWLCRLLKELGARPIGFDKSLQGDEEFERHKVDLFRVNLADYLQPGSVDVACSFNVFDSPLLKAQYGDKAGKRLFARFGKQLEPILRPEGVFLFSTWDLAGDIQRGYFHNDYYEKLIEKYAEDLAAD
jgi:hypothetical protein